MKLVTIFALALFSLALVSSQTIPLDASAQGKKIPEALVLSKQAKLGAVAFNHLKHATGKVSPDGAQGVACTECHHTARAASEPSKNPLHKTIWPADRGATLTAELLEKDASTTVAICTDCHARAGEKPKLVPAIPELKIGDAAEPTVLNNQQAFHINCGVCHDEAVKARPGLDPAPPTSKKCTACHKKGVA